MLFQQTSAPTGWTKSTTHDNKALRIVSGTVGSGGSSTFSAVFNGSVSATTLTTSQIPSHSHSQRRFTTGSLGLNTNSATGFSNATVADISPTTGNAGGGGSHTHSMNVAYVDVIIATKN